MSKFKVGDLVYWLHDDCYFGIILTVYTEKTDFNYRILESDAYEEDLELLT